MWLTVLEGAPTTGVVFLKGSLGPDPLFQRGTLKLRTHFSGRGNEACPPAQGAHRRNLHGVSPRSQGSRGSCRSQQCSCSSHFRTAAGHTRRRLPEQSPQAPPSSPRASGGSGTEGLAGPSPPLLHLALSGWTGSDPWAGGGGGWKEPLKRFITPVLQTEAQGGE